MPDATPQTAPQAPETNSADEKTVVLDPNRTEVIRPGEEPPAAQPNAGPMADYTICGKVGDGGMGVVYLARDRRLGRYVAIKRLNEKALADPVLRQRFLQEARAVAALNHAYIVHIYALGEDALGPYIIMEYVSGPAQTEAVPAGQDAPPPKNLTLEQFVNRNGPMTADEAVAMILKIARTMVYAHSCGVIHRDLKPANILLDPTGEPKLVDFGLARIAPQEGRTQVAELTVPGEKLISLGYSAPELEQDASSSDVRADIYSLGAILYFLLTGRNPRYYREQDVPAFLREVMRRSLETVREQRYRTAQDFVNALSEAASHGRTVAPTIKTTWRCKWCDAVNPISTKFCAECGWDGSERCLECGAETFVGQQYCPSCGADCRMYEHVASIIKLMDQAWDERHFERIATIAGRLHGFDPAGPTGRKLLADAHARVEEAERKVARRNRLAALIPNELKAENYERAQAFIEEFRTLNEDAMVYEEELRDIPAKILARDLVRIRQCIRRRDWPTARRLTANLAAKYGNMPEYQDVRARVEAHGRRLRRAAWACGVAAAAALYLLSLPWAARLAGGTFGTGGKTLYAPARALAALPGLGALLDGYARLCGGQSTADYFPGQAPAVMAAPAAPHRPPLPDGLGEDRDALDAALREIADRRTAQDDALLMQYWRNLTDLRDSAQKAGDYEGVVATTHALDAYAETNDLGAVADEDPATLAGIKRHMARRREEQRILSARQVRAVVHKYRDHLEARSKEYTQRGEMGKAGAVREELARLAAIPAVRDAQLLLKETRPDLFLGDEASMAEIERLRAEIRGDREELRKNLRALNEKAQQTLGDWPAQYGDALNALLRDFQQSGNFNALEAVAIELSRFEEQKALGPANVVDFPDGLRQTQATFLQRLQTVQGERDTAKAAVFAAYLADLEKRQTELTKAGEFAAAAVVNQELRDIRQSRAYQSVALPHAAPAQQPPPPAPAREPPPGDEAYDEALLSHADGPAATAPAPTLPLSTEAPHD